MIRLYSISKEDLLIKFKQAECENTLLRKKLIEQGKLESFIEELQDKIKVMEHSMKKKKSDDKFVDLLELRIKNLKKKAENQKTLIKQLHKKRGHDKN